LSWQGNLLKAIYKISSYLNTVGIGNLKIVRGLKPQLNSLLMQMFGSDSSLLINIHGLSMYIYPNTADGRAYLLRPFEPYTTELFRRAVKPGATVLDIGAQLGYFSLLAARQGAQTVYAFEPAPGNFKLLERNVQANGYTNIIQKVPKAVGSSQGAVVMFIYEGSDSHAMYRHPLASVREKISVECVTVDEFLPGQPIDVIKMDIEGNEPHALEGMRRTIAANERLILFSELAPDFLRRAGVQPRDYLAQLSAMDFDIKLIDEQSHCLRPLDKRFLLQGDPGRYMNLYCVKGSS
jgi:FkbM family methyltransferase